MEIVQGKTSSWLKCTAKKISDRKQGNGKDDNKLITNICTDDKSLSCASTRLRSGVISMYEVPVQIFH